MKIARSILKNVQGEKVFLNSIGEDSKIYIIPKKYSVKGNDFVKNIRLASLPSESRAEMFRTQNIISKVNENTEESEDEKTIKILDKLSDKQISVFIDVQQRPVEDYWKAVIKEGLFEHNFFSEEIINEEGNVSEKLISSKEIPDELLDFIFESTELAEEIVNIIEEFNAPLQQKNARK